MKVGDVVYYPPLKDALYIEQMVIDEGETTYLFRIMNKRLKDGKPTIGFTYSGGVTGFKTLDMNKEVPDRYWFGYLNKANDSKRILVYGDILYTLLIENADGDFTEFNSLTKQQLAKELDYFTDSLCYDIYIDDDLVELLWEEQND